MLENFYKIFSPNAFLYLIIYTLFSLTKVFISFLKIYSDLFLGIILYQ